MVAHDVRSRAPPSCIISLMTPCIPDRITQPLRIPRAVSVILKAPAGDPKCKFSRNAVGVVVVQITGATEKPPRE